MFMQTDDIDKKRPKTFVEQGIGANIPYMIFGKYFPILLNLNAWKINFSNELLCPLPNVW